MIVVDRLGLIGPDVLLPVRVDYGDMRYLTVAYSLPENVMIQVLVRDAAEHFGGYRTDFIYLNTNAKRPDAFAALDRMAYLLVLGLAGFRHFYMGAGQMSMDEIFSPAQFIIDMEMGRYAQHVIDGMLWKGDPKTITEAVADGVAEGSFLANATTLEMLPHLFDSKLFRRSNVGQWRAAGEPTIEQLALEQARTAIDSYRFEREASAQTELDRVFEEACRAQGVNLAAQPLPAR